MEFEINTQRQISTIIVSVIFTVLPTIAVALRVLARRIQGTHLSSSDYCIFGALICDWGLFACVIVNVVRGGLGLHQADVPLLGIETFLSSGFAIELLWAAAEGLVKTSMCLLYIQIFRLRTFRIAAYIVICACNAFALMVVLSTTLICTPVRMSFDPTTPGTCGNRNALWLTIGILNIITDLMVVVLPMPMVWQLQIPRNKRLALLSIFSLGLFVCIASCLRLQNLMLVNYTSDITYTVTNSVIWSLLEPTLAVTIGSLPTLAPLFRKYFQNTPSPGRNGHSHAINLAALDSKNPKSFHPLFGQETMHEPLTSNIVSTTANPFHHSHSSAETRQGLERTSSEMSVEGPGNGINIVTKWEVRRQ